MKHILLHIILVCAVVASEENPLLRIDELRQAMSSELERRRCGTTGFSCAEMRGGVETLYGITGAVNVTTRLGLPLDGSRRQDAAARIRRT